MDRKWLNIVLFVVIVVLPFIAVIVKLLIER